MATTSRVPAALDALLAIAGSAPGLDGVAVVDGPEPVNLTALDRIHIGWSPGAEAAVALQQSFNAAGARTRDESFDIACYAEVRGGETGMAVRRSRVFALLAELEDALRATAAAPTAPTLNGTVLWAELTTGNLREAQTPDGAQAGLEFTVHCRARI